MNQLEDENLVAVYKVAETVISNANIKLSLNQNSTVFFYIIQRIPQSGINSELLLGQVG